MNILEKTLNFGFGLFAYSKEKVEELVDELVKKGEVAKIDAQKFADDMVKKGEEQRCEMKKFIDDEVTSALSRMNIAKKSDIVSKEEIGNIVREQLLQVLNEQETKKENS